jgi:UPF0755 protein
MRRVRLALLIGIPSMLVIVAGLGIWVTYFRSAHIPPGHSVLVEIPKGAGTRAIARLLTNDGIVANANMFDLRTRLDGADGKLHAGEYDLTTGMDYEEVILQLEEGPSQLYSTVTIPEGFSARQIAQRLQARAGISATEFERVALTQADSFKAKYPFLAGDSTPSLEGYLFPKTYRVRKGSTASDVIAMMLDQFGQETAGLDLKYASSRGLDLHGVVTIASIIEREAAKGSDRPLVASVIYNRLKIGMRLQVDPTVMYVVGQKAHLYNHDLQVDSPYNTYRHAGLPPGPIASPGLKSLEAAAHPATTSNLFYILVGGKMIFTTNNADFLKAKQRAAGTP